MKKQYILPVIIIVIGMILVGYASNRQKAEKALAITTNETPVVNKTTATIGIIGGILMIVGIAIFLNRWQ